VADDARTSVPDRLLGPFFEAAADALHTLDLDDVPLALRRLRGFDRRGLMHGPAPRALRQAFDGDERFRAEIVEQFGRRAAIADALTEWSSGDAWDVVQGSVVRGELPTLASALWVCRPDRADLGLGMIVALDAIEQRERDDASAANARARAAEELEEALRRADSARVEAEAETERARRELRDERRLRREREEQVDAKGLVAEQRVEELESELLRLRVAAADERGRAGREAQRARVLDDALRRARADLEEMRTHAEHAPSRLSANDARAIAEVSTEARQLSARLEAIRARVAASRPTDSGPADEPARAAARPLVRRVQPQLPPGIVASSPAGIEAMLGSADALLVVDGYNVTKRAWPEATAAEQRERIEAALTRLQRRVGFGALCVFDGADHVAHWRTRRGGVRIAFSDAAEEADELIVREIVALPKRVPVVVASSDAWVREHAEAEGAVVVPAEALLAFLRK
jgi:predicted RNA-binding protein with PIN domain